MIGVLSSSGLDDGRGAARSLVLRHRHEQENGRTSAVTMEIMGYAKDGQQVRSPSVLPLSLSTSFLCFSGRACYGFRDLRLRSLNFGWAQSCYRRRLYRAFLSGAMRSLCHWLKFLASTWVRPKIRRQHRSEALVCSA